jgi:hypothetical protein
MIDPHVLTGSELPPLAWHHHRENDPARITEEFRRPSFDEFRSKPIGGLWTSPYRLLPGGQLDTAWQHGPHPSRGIGAWVTPLVPHAAAKFLVIDSHADAVAAAQLLSPGGTLQDKIRALTGEPEGVSAPRHSSMLDGPVIDFTSLPALGYAGAYVTDYGQAVCSLHNQPDIPDLWGWDVATVWFAAPVVTVGATAATGGRAHAR